MNAVEMMVQEALGQKKEKKQQLTGIARRGVQRVNRFNPKSNRVMLIEADGEMWITDTYRAAKLPIEEVAALNLRAGMVVSSNLTAGVGIQDAPVPVIKQLIEIAECVEIEAVGTDVIGKVSVVKFQAEEFECFINAEFLKEAIGDGAVKFVGKSKFQPVRAIDAAGIVVGVMMPIRKD